MKHFWRASAYLVLCGVLLTVASPAPGALVASFDLGDAVAPSVPAPVAGPAGTTTNWTLIHGSNFSNPPRQNGVRLMVGYGTGFIDSRPAYNDLLSDGVYELNGGDGANWRLEGLVAGATYELYLMAVDGTGFGVSNTYDTTFTVFDGDPDPNGSARASVNVIGTATVHPTNTGAGFDGVWVEGVHFAKLTFRANASVVYGMYELASGGKHSGLAGAQLVLLAESAGLFWNFPAYGELNGWGLVSQGATGQPKALVRGPYVADMNSSPVLSTAYRHLGGSAPFVGDNTHDPIVIRSPYFRVTVATALTWRCVGGNVTNVGPGPGTGPYPTNAQGVAFVRARDATRLLSQRIAVTGTPAVLSMDVSPYAGDGETYYLEVVDVRAGAGGSLECDDFLVPGELVAEGPDIERISLVSDATWRTISGSASIPAGWHTNLTYDDSGAAGWTNAVIDTANRIWHTSGFSSSGPSSARFRKVINLPRKVRAAHAVFAADDDGDFFINGTLAWHDASGGASETWIELDPGLLREGDNLLAVFGQDVVAAAHVIAVEILVQFEPEPVLGIAPGSGLTLERLDLNRVYSLQVSTNLQAGGGWHEVASFVAQHFATNRPIADLGASPQGCFRLEGGP